MSVIKHLISYFILIGLPATIVSIELDIVVQPVVKIEQVSPYEKMFLVHRVNKDDVICNLPEEQKYQLCQDALRSSYWQRRNINIALIEDSKPGEVEIYRIYYYGGYYNPARYEYIEAAFQCPTKPPMYLRQGVKTYTVYCMVENIQQRVWPTSTPPQKPKVQVFVSNDM